MQNFKDIVENTVLLKPMSKIDANSFFLMYNLLTLNLLNIPFLRPLQTF